MPVKKLLIHCIQYYHLNFQSFYSEYLWIRSGKSDKFMVNLSGKEMHL